MAVWIGDNDVQECDDGRAASDIAEELALKIIAQASALKALHKIDEVYLIQLLPRFYTPYSRSTEQEIARYNTIAHQVNNFLYAEAYECGINILFLNFRFPEEDPDEKRYVELRSSFHRDGVHLNARGYKKCVKGLRHIAIRTCRHAS